MDVGAHESLRTTLAPSSLFRAGKILIYVNTDYHKLHNLIVICSVGAFILFIIPLQGKGC